MIRSDRRSVIKGGVAMALAGGLPLRGTGEKPAVFIFDARFAPSQALAREWSGLGVPVLDPRDLDLGIAWRSHIPQLVQQGGWIEGVTLWSDRFVCETMGRAHGLLPSPLGLDFPGQMGGGLRRWRLG